MKRFINVAVLIFFLCGHVLYAADSKISIKKTNEAEAKTITCHVNNFMMNWVFNMAIELAEQAIQDAIKDKWNKYYDLLYRYWTMPDMVLVGNTYDVLKGYESISVNGVRQKVRLDDIFREQRKILLEEPPEKVYNTNFVITGVAGTNNPVQLGTQIRKEINSGSSQTLNKIIQNPPVPPSGTTIQDMDLKDVLKQNRRYLGLYHEPLDVDKIVATVPASHRAYAVKTIANLKARQQMLQDVYLSSVENLRYAVNVEGKMENIKFPSNRTYQQAVKENTKLLQINNILLAKILQELNNQILLKDDKVSEQVHHEILEIQK